MDSETPRYDTPDLLGHADFLRSLVRGLVNDSHHGEDVIQDTWLTALQRPPRNPGALRAWLATVARNFALKSHRAQRSRNRREEAVARKEPHPSTDRVVAHQALLRDVTDAVLALDEPYQEVIFLRFYEQLPPREIAARLGAPVETVRSRQKRALEQLRGKLAATHGKDWRQLLLPLLPMPTALDQSPPPQPTGASLLVKGMASARIVLGVAGALHFALGGSGEGDRGQGGHPDRVALTPGSTDGDPATTRKAEPDRRELTALAPLEGLVVDGRGNPVAGARVLGLPRPPLQLSTARKLTFTLSGSDPDRVMEAAGRIPLFPGEVYSRDLARALLTNLDGSTTKVRTRTDARGRFRLTSPWSRTWLMASSKGMRLSTPLVGPSRRPLVLTLLPGGALTVKVIDAKGDPVGFGRVRLLELDKVYMPSPFDYPTATFLEEEVDREGRATFRGLTPGRDHLALFLGSGWGYSLSPPLTTPADGTMGHGRITACPACSLAVRVQDRSGAPLAGVRVRPTTLAWPPVAKAILPDLTGHSDSRGVIRIEGLPPGRTHLDGWQVGRTPAEIFLDLDRSHQQTTLVLTRGRELAGRVTWTDGSPAEDVVVGFSAPRYQSELVSARSVPHLYLDPASIARSDEKGRFLLSGLPDRPVDLVAISQGFTLGRLDRVDPSSSGRVEFKLARAGGIAGRAVDQNGNPLDGIQVQVWQQNEKGIYIFYNYKDFRSRDGRFRFARLPAGMYRVLVHHPGLAAARSGPVRIWPGGITEIEGDLLLGPPTRISGRVVDRRGNPQPGICLELVPGDRNCPSNLLEPLQATSAPDGSFSFDATPPGWWGIRTLPDPRGTAFAGGPFITAPHRSITGVTIHLDPLARVVGTLYDQEGRPLPHTPIQALNMSAFNKPVTWGWTDEAGRFRLPAMPPGTWWLVALTGDFLEVNQRLRQEIRSRGELMTRELSASCTEVSVKLEPGREIRVVLGNPHLGSASLEGRVTRGVLPLANIKVFISPECQGKPTVSPTQVGTDRDGRFTFDRLRPGVYTLSVMYQVDGDVRCQRRITLEEGDQKSISVAFGSGQVQGRLVPQPGCQEVGGVNIMIEGQDKGGIKAHARTDREGRFAVPCLPPGRYLARIATALGHWGAPGRPVGSVSFAVDAARPIALVEIAARGTGSILGQVLRPQWYGSLVEVKVKGWPKPFGGVVDKQGRFNLTSIPPGQVTISLHPPTGEERAERVLELPGGDTLEVTFP